MPGNIAFSILTYVLAVALGFFINYLINKLKISKANVSAAKIIDDATAKADNLVKEAILDAKTEPYELKDTHSGGAGFQEICTSVLVGRSGLVASL